MSMKQNKVRISEADQQAIVRAVLLATSNNVYKIWVFGSRTDLQKKGGDLDLWIELNAPSKFPRKLVQTIRLALEDEIGEQKVDLQISGPLELLDDPKQIAFHEAIKGSMVELWNRNP